VNEAPDAAERRGAGFWIGLVVGFAIMAYGIRGALINHVATQPARFAIWLVGADLLHDAIVAPVVCSFGWLLTRVVPRPWRAPVRAGLMTTALVVAIGWIPLRGYGRLSDNPSLEPLNYATAMLTAIAIVWIACAVWAAVLAARSRPPAAQLDAVRPETS
jgi:hypothetical protein